MSYAHAMSYDHSMSYDHAMSYDHSMSYTHTMSYAYNMINEHVMTAQSIPFFVITFLSPQSVVRFKTNALSNA